MGFWVSGTKTWADELKSTSPNAVLPTVKACLVTGVLAKTMPTCDRSV